MGPSAQPGAVNYYTSDGEFVGTPPPTPTAADYYAWAKERAKEQDGVLAAPISCRCQGCNRSRAKLDDALWEELKRDIPTISYIDVRLSYRDTGVPGGAIWHNRPWK